MSKIAVSVLLAAAVAAGIGLERLVLSKGELGSVQAAESGEPKPLYWVAPMDPNYKRDQPGKSPMGMDLVPVYAEDVPSDASLVKIPAAVVNSLGVRTEEVMRVEQVQEVVTLAQIQYDDNSLSHIHTRTDGWIEVLNVKEVGDPVSKGEVLFELYSPTLVNAQEEFLSVLATGNATLIQASAARLRSLGINDRLIEQLKKSRKARQRVQYLSDRNGYITNLPASEGQYVTPQQEIMAISDLNSIWAIADVFEKDSQWLKVGQPAELALDYLPGRTFQGAIEYIYPALDPKTRTLSARLRFDNPELLLKPNMFAQVRIQASTGEQVISVPQEAVIRGGKADRVVIALEEGEFKSVPVRLGMAFGDRVTVLSGVDEGQQVVTSGQFLIDSESNIDAELERMAAAEKAQTALAQGVAGRGVIQSVMADHGMLTIDHQPIEVLGWPGMVMNFMLADGVDLGGLEAGQQVQFTLVEDDGDYLIETISPMQPRAVAGRGVVRQVMSDHGMLSIEHEPIEALGWPSMTMNFSITDGLSIDHLQAGQTIEFDLFEDDGDFMISRINTP